MNEENKNKETSTQSKVTSDAYSKEKEDILEKCINNRKTAKIRSHKQKMTFVLDIIVILALFLFYKSFGEMKEKFFYVSCDATVIDWYEVEFLDNKQNELDNAAFEDMKDCRYCIVICYEYGGSRYTKNCYVKDLPSCDRGDVIPIQIYVFDANSFQLESGL